MQAPVNLVRPLTSYQPQHSLIFANMLRVLINRLEAATSRLEDIASSTQDSQQPPGIPAVAASAAAAIPPSQQAAQAVAPAPTPKQAPPPLPESVEAFDALINEEVKKFAALSDNLGGLLAEQVTRRQSWHAVVSDRTYSPPWS
jgi:hypothetical protein